MNSKKYIINQESERLSLRNVISSDKDFLINLWTNEVITRHMGGPRKKEKMSAIADEMIADPYLEEYDLWILTEKSTKRPIGHCGLLEKEVEGQQEIEVIYVIDEAAWGKGYASEACQMLLEYAFDIKKLNRVIALIKPDNRASEQVAKKCGMTLEKEVTREGHPMCLYVKDNKRG